VQTSTAVAAGLSQFQPSVAPTLKVPEPSKERNGASGSSSVAKSGRTKLPLMQSHTIEPVADPSLSTTPRPYIGPDKILLRVDAFLGEWLSPDYFEDITPPPNSTMMVAGSKADLLRRGDLIREMARTNESKGFFPGGWAGKAAVPTKGNLASLPAFRERSGSQGSALLQRTKSGDDLAALVVPHTPAHIYEPPVPSYSVSPADSIPRGYVAHAQEACIRVDYQWDSMRPPQEWGDGGEYGDEWSTMHKRFRKGLAGMMQWYREHGTLPAKDQTRGFMFKEPLRLTPAPVKNPSSSPIPGSKGEVDGEDDEELVLVLVTHGAGCNALLGAMSNQPVLIDVGLASLSMAVRRKEPRPASESKVQERRSSVADPGMADTYDMKLLASVDHLKPGSDPSRLQSPPQARSSVSLPSPSTESRRRFAASDSPVGSSFSNGDPYRSWNSSLGSMRRTMSSGSDKGYMQSNLNPKGSGSSLASTGLWSSSKITTVGAGISDDQSSPASILDFDHHDPNSKPTPDPLTTSAVDAHKSAPAVDGTLEVIHNLTKLNTNEEKEVSDNVAPLRTGTHNRMSSNTSTGLWGAKPQTKSVQGLWGPPRLDDVYEHERGAAPKRRWTVTERENAI
jgi:hypothetical protein